MLQTALHYLSIGNSIDFIVSIILSVFFGFWGRKKFIKKQEQHAESLEQRIQHDYEQMNRLIQVKLDEYPLIIGEQKKVMLQKDKLIENLQEQLLKSTRQQSKRLPLDCSFPKQ